MNLLIPILVLGLLASLSPTTIVVFILLLGTLRAKVNAVAFMIGWGISLTLVFSFAYALGGAGPLQDGAGRTGVNVAEILLGLVMSGLAVRAWRRRDHPRKPSRLSTRVVAHFTELHPWQASAVGILKQPWALTAAAAVVVVHHHVAAVVALLAFLLFTVFSTATVAAMFLYYARRPSEAELRLADLGHRVQEAGPALTAGILLVVGIVVVIDGLTGL